MGADECEAGMWRSITGNQLGSSVTGYDRHYPHHEINHLTNTPSTDRPVPVLRLTIPETDFDHINSHNDHFPS